MIDPPLSRRPPPTPLRQRGLTLIGGAVRSGKSRFALARASQAGTRRVFVATAEARDDEMRSRVIAHQAERGDAFETVEEPLHLAATIAARTDYDALVVDCLTLWLSNHLLRDEDETALREKIDELVVALAQPRGRVIIVSNEVGMGIVPPSRLGRMFRDVAGYAHQRLAAVADEVFVATMGVVLELVPGPVRAVPTSVPTAPRLDGQDRD
ncbi:MAG: bifunctional adenosylcobinamide kinase/adenosylcobinamide-phosphate guanylyltransferase [Myxococcales bacterium FL481]|nr:MAG: bifunctional adenosylcobinamide kinase/adenosylcobinamide-phosphate guanylyltransferase [Myxococcales bacterium FL481]